MTPLTLFVQKLFKLFQRGFLRQTVLENNPNCIGSRNENRDTALLDLTKDIVRSGSLELLDAQSLDRNTLRFLVKQLDNFIHVVFHCL